MLVAAHIITAVQSIVSRNVRPIDGAVVSLCAMQAGDLGAMSVMPGKATLVGTVRTFSARRAGPGRARLDELCSAVALGFGATATVNFERIYPATINTRARSRCSPRDVAESLVGARQRRARHGAEHGRRGFFLHAAGQARRLPAHRPGRARAAACLHNSRYDFNDDILPLGAALHASLVEQAHAAGGQR